MSQVQQFLNKKFPWFQKVKILRSSWKMLFTKTQADHSISFLIWEINELAWSSRWIRILFGIYMYSYYLKKQLNSNPLK